MVEEINEKTIRQYLLGELAEAEMVPFEERLMTDDLLFEMLLVVEDELIDERAEGELSAEEQARFDAYFLATPQRRERLELARALDDYARHDDKLKIVANPTSGATNDPVNATPSTNATEPLAKDVPSPVLIIPPGRWSAPRRYLILAAAAIILIAVGFGVWPIISYRLDISRGMAALNKAYTENPTEARITELNLPPPSVTRGADSNKVDRIELKRAERYLDDAVHERAAARAYHAAGRLYLAEKDFDEAIKNFEQALQLDANNAQLYSDLGAAWLEKGKAIQPTENGGRRFEALGQSLDYLSRALQLNNGLLEALFNRALCYEAMARPQEALEGWQTYLEKDPNSQWAAEAKHRLKLLGDQKSSSLYDQQTLFQQFVTAYQHEDEASAWEAFRQSRTRTGNVITEQLLDGGLDLLAQRRNEAVSDYLQMLSYAGEVEFQKVGDRFTKDLARFYQTQLVKQPQPIVEARRLLKAASDRVRQSEYEEAVSLYSKAKRRFEQMGDESNAAFAESWIGIANLRIEPKKSLEILQPLCYSLENRKYLYLLTQALNGLADAQSSQRNVSECLETGKRGAEVAEQINDLNSVLRNWQIAVAMYFQVGKYQQSLEWISRALNRALLSSTDPLEMWTFYHQAAINFYSLGLPHAALDFQQEALRLAIASGRALYKSRSYARLGLIYEKLKDENAALRNAELALNEGQNVEGKRSRANLVANAALHLADLYRQRGDLRQSLAYYDQAIESHANLGIEIYVLEAHRGKLLAQFGLLDDMAVEEELKQTLPLIEQYRPKILEESNRNSFFDLAQSIYDVAIDFADARLHKEELAFDYVETSHARSLLDLMQSTATVVDEEGKPEIKMHPGAASLTCADIKQHLPDQAQLLEFCVLDNKILAFMISGADLKHSFNYIAVGELNEKIQRYLSLVKRPDERTAGEMTALAKQLYELLIGPVESLLDPNKYLCIVPDRSLNNLPFGALVSSSDRYFIQDHLFVLAPSASIFIACTEAASKKASLKTEHLLSVGNPSFDQNQFANLPAAAREVKEIARLYNASPPLLGDKARESVIKKEMLRADVVHVASHYIIDERSPMLSKLLLAKEADESNGKADDGFLHASEIYDMQLPRTRLVVLSACQTGVEQSYRGEGVISIARPFIKARVPIVVASLWPVDSDATSDFMISFHRHRKQKELKPMSVAAALQAAQLDMLGDADPRHHHPYYWASFAAIGGYTTF